jgi:hypothetical protein
LTVLALRIILRERCFTKEVLLKFFVFLIIAISFFVSCNSQNHDLHDSPDAHDFDKETETIDETTDETVDESPDEK